MSSDHAVLIAIALVIAATAIGIYTENKKPATGPATFPSSQPFVQGHPLAN